MAGYIIQLRKKDASRDTQTGHDYTLALGEMAWKLSTHTLQEHHSKKLLRTSVSYVHCLIHFSTLPPCLIAIIL